jgi:hypothetical protein
VVDGKARAAAAAARRAAVAGAAEEEAAAAARKARPPAAVDPAGPPRFRREGTPGRRGALELAAGRL